MKLENTEPRVYRISEYVYPSFLEKLAKLNRKAKKLNCPPVSATIVGSVEKIDEETNIVTVTNLVTLQGVTPKVNGYSFIARVEREEHGNIIKSFLNSDVPERFRQTDFFCQHCKKKRGRAKLFILQAENGEYIQVGGNCLADFLQGDKLNDYANYAEWVSKMEDLFEESEGEISDEQIARLGRYEPAYGLTDYLGYVVCSIQKDGWISRSGKEYDQTATADSAHHAMATKGTGKSEITDEQWELAKAATEWAFNLNANGAKLSDYLYNLNTIALSRKCTYKTMGYAASIINAYQRDLEKKATKELEASLPKQEKKDSEYVGTVGKREIFKNMVVINIAFCAGYMEDTTTKIHKFMDDQQNIYTWFSSSQELEKGMVYTLKGTVKEHSLYKGVKQTVLSRCNVQEVKEISKAG